MTRLKAIIESTPELIGGSVAATPPTEITPEQAIRFVAGLRIRELICDLECALGVVKAFPITRHLCEALDQLGRK
jgi:hypothetical protein